MKKAMFFHGCNHFSNFLVGAHDLSKLDRTLKLSIVIKYHSTLKLIYQKKILKASSMIGKINIQ